MKEHQISVFLSNKNINDRVLAKARAKKITQGKRLRVDSTVTEMNIHCLIEKSGKLLMDVNNLKAIFMTRERTF